MKDFFNQRQRYSLRKYSIGVCSVLLGIVLFSGQAVQADEVITGNDNVVKSVEAAESAISDTTISEVPTAIEKLPVEEVVTVQNETVSKQQDTSSETNTSRNSTSFASSEESYVAQVNQSQATSDLSEGLKSETITSEISRTSLRRGRILASEETVESSTEILSSEAIPAEIPIRRSGRRGRNMSSLNTSESNNGTPINSSLPTVTIPTSNQNNTLATPDENITKSTKQTVVFEGAGEKTPATNIKDDYVFTGKKDLTTNAITWKTSSHTYGSVPVPVVPGYYADKAEAGFKTVTLDEPEVTDKVIYKPLGKIIQVDENFNVIPNSNSVTYENNPYNPREAIETAIPAAPAGYKIRELQPHAWGYNIVDKTIEPNDESDPDRISKDTPIVYVPLTSDVTKSTKQTVVFEGAGEKTPATNIKDDYVFTGKKDLTTNAITWKTSSHTYGSVPVPVVPGYYADKAEAGFKTVTLDEPEVTDKVIYKPLGKIIQVDENFNVIPNSNSVTYENNPYNPREAIETAIPAAPAGYKIRELQPHAWGYNIVDKTIEPNDESDPDRISKDTPIVYVPLTSDVTKSTKQTVVFEGAGEKTPATNIKDDYVFTGKKDLTTNAITWKTSSHTYGSVPVPVVPGYIADKSQAGQLEVTVATPNAEETVSYTPVGRIIFVDEAGNQIVGTNAVPYTNAPDPTKVESTTLPTLPTGYEIKSGQNISGFNSSSLQVLPPDATADTKIILVSKKETLNQGTSQTVTFVGAGEKTPATKVQNDFVFTGTKDMVSGVSTWDVSSHRYGSVPVPVVPGYIADKSQAGQLEVTLATPNVEELVSYTPVGRIIFVDEARNQIVGTNAVPYTNALDPTKIMSTTLPTLPAGYEIKYGQNILGLNSSNLQVLPSDATADTKIILVSKKESLSQGTSQTVTFVGAGENTPTTKVQNDFVFTGTKDMVSGVSTWDVSSHRYGSVPVPVVPGYIADKSQAGQLEVTVATPNAEELVSYTPVGRIILVDEAGNQIVGTDAVPYNNSLDPTKVESTSLPTLPTGYEIKPGQNISGLNSSNLQVLPPDATADTKIILVSKKESLSQGTSQTVTFVGAGKNTPATKVQNDFVFTGTKDMVSGVSIWDMSSHRYSSVPVPVVPGYIANVGHAGSLQVTPEAPNAEELVTYKPLGKIIAVDTDGKEIQGVPTIQYQNDPENPTKAGKTLSPLISGYETDVLNITPSKPEEDTPVVYRKAIQEATITYIDQTTGTSLESDHVTGKSGEIIEYTTADKIAFYESRGYELLTDEFPKQAYYDTDTSVTQAWRVTLKHKTVIVGSRNPHDGDAINPDDPLSPKYPSKNQWQKDVTATVHYIVSDGNVKAPSDKVQDAQWTRTVTYDMVTGQELSSTAWKANKATYDAVVTEVLDGYYADKASVSSKKVIQENLEETVIYKPLGSLLLKSADLNFPEVASVKYPNNLTDPTKSGLPVVPDIPGYKPYLQDPKYPSKLGKAIQPGSTIIPENSGEDISIYYIAVSPDKPKSSIKQMSKPSKTQKPEHPSIEKKSVVSSQPEEVKQVNEASRIVVKTASQTSTTKVASYKKQVVLPKTGEETEQTVEVAGFSALIVALGLGIQGYRRKKED
ncbi:MAG: mucin-binding protein [Streptococcus salivarius]